MQAMIMRFDGHCDHLAMLMDNLLRSKEYWNIMENGVALLSVTATPESKAEKKLISKGQILFISIHL